MAIPSNIDRFDIIRELGKGSQGVVYLASDSRLERQVAIKTLHKQSLMNGHRQERLLQEARTVGRLQHPNIIPLYEAGEYNGLLYLVFEYVDGVSLKELIRKNGPFVVHKAIELIIAILDGISCAHDQGIIHRDLSPSNILIDKKGLPRIMDFGISVMAGSGNNPDREIAGTPYYMSPEHFSEGALVTQSDIFSLGLIFYEMLVGMPVIEADNEFTIMYKIANETIHSPSLKNQAIDSKLDAIILKALEKDPESRYTNASQMKEALETYLNPDYRSDPASNSQQSHSTLEFLLRRIRHKSDFPTFSHNIMEINKKASVSQLNYASASELANAVLKDYSLTSKLLKLVNSAFYGQFAGKITTVSRAVVVLGFEEVSMAASSLMLFEQLKNKGQMSELRDAAASSLMSGMIAKDLAKRLRVNGTEEVFICSMLHNLGKHLVLFYFEEEYGQIKNLMAQKGVPENTAARSVLGMTYEELGMGIAKAWKFPSKIVTSMKELPKGQVERPRSEVEMLQHLSGFSNELCMLIGGGDEGGDKEALAALLKRFEKSFALSKKQISELLESSKEKIDEYSNIFNVSLKQSNFLKQLENYSQSQKEETSLPRQDRMTQKEPREMIQDSYDDMEIPELSTATVEIKDPQTILINGIQDITNTLLEDFDLNHVLSMILETMYRGFAFHRVLFCIMNSRMMEMRARFGFGQDIEKVLKNFHFKVKQAPDVFNFAVLQGKDVGIDDAKDSRFRKRMPEWFQESIIVSAFVLYPIVIHKRPVGLIYADRELPGKVLTGNQANFMKTLCNQAVLALKQMK
ncbi:MAG: HDOD domain-containing protein [Deltaproteobacteria bacterium]|nr:HDOD domain-containing protein [Deltaproteobacteria bacterium]